jgi:hypothetical protein
MATTGQAHNALTPLANAPLCQLAAAPLSSSSSSWLEPLAASGSAAPTATSHRTPSPILCSALASSSPLQPPRPLGTPLVATAAPVKESEQSSATCAVASVAQSTSSAGTAQRKQPPPVRAKPFVAATSRSSDSAPSRGGEDISPGGQTLQSQARPKSASRTAGLHSEEPQPTSSSFSARTTMPLCNNAITAPSSSSHGRALSSPLHGNAACFKPAATDEVPRAQGSRHTMTAVQQESGCQTSQAAPPAGLSDSSSNLRQRAEKLPPPPGLEPEAPSTSGTSPSPRCNDGWSRPQDAERDAWRQGWQGAEPPASWSHSWSGSWWAQPDSKDWM